MIHGVIDDCCMVLDPHSIGVWSFSISGAFERFPLFCITRDFLHSGSSLHLIFGVSCPRFRFYTPCRGAVGPGKKLPFLDRDCWIPILSTASAEQSKEGCLASSFISFVPSTHPHTDLSWLSSAELSPAHVLQNKNLRIITKPSTQTGLRAFKALITYAASSASFLNTIHSISYSTALRLDSVPFLASRILHLLLLSLVYLQLQL